MKPTARFIHWNEIEGFRESPDKSSFKSEINAEGAAAFIEAHPEFPRMECTAERLREFYLSVTNRWSARILNWHTRRSIFRG
jgi:hypothetical protein